ncbi:hypothetical protein [Flagellimonas allohymeniacidonis]|uniref:Uncharacterized protein n=1 Tax=Flagellimonas allohymeniacidonis TaxID=2517819 RepID=A0A4Q8QML5_9FLAO|nr:hypothetical protein [Allomuricauda hymeniacidonis]TAI49556.1 hypothetical protein EW142_07085 [Allomuricauda hymeniacidonis]
MKFNWIISGANNAETKKACIDLEYRLRPKITRFLMDRLDTDDFSNFSCFYFDVDIKNQWVWISEKTPKDYIESIKEEFDREINGSSFFSVA